MKDHIEELKKITSSLIERSDEQERFNKRKDVLIEILTALNLLDSEKESVNVLLDIVQNYTNVDAVGIRLKRHDDFPYYASKGFSKEFLALEASLKCKDVVFSEHADDLECMCGYVIQGKNKKDYPFFTEFGSFYTLDSFGLVNGDYGPLPINIKVRGVCVKNEYQTVVTIPLFCKSGDIVGLLQLNDRKKHAVSLDTIAFFEGIGINIGTALNRIRLMNCLKERCSAKYDRPHEHNELQFNCGPT